MGVWLGPRGKRDLSVDLNSFTAKSCRWYSTTYTDGEPPVLNYSNGVLAVSISKQWHGDTQTGYGNDKAGIAVSGPLNLSKYNKLIVDFSDLAGWGPAAFYVSPSNTTFEKSADEVYYQFNQSESIAHSSVELDVSGLTGTYYFGVAIQASGTSDYTATLTKSVTINSVTVTAD